MSNFYLCKLDDLLQEGLFTMMGNYALSSGRKDGLLLGRKNLGHKIAKAYTLMMKSIRRNHQWFFFFPPNLSNIADCLKMIDLLYLSALYGQ